MAKNVGWIKLFRKLIDNRIYFIEPFDKIHAWVDLILIADADGHVSTSIRELADRWKWSVSTTKRYLDLLEREEMITTSRNSGGTRYGTGNETRSGTQITLVNYENYQGQRNTGRNTMRNTDESSEWGKGDLYNIYITRREEDNKTPNTLTGITPKGGEKHSGYDDDFAEFWNLYPKKDGRKNALQSYIKARKNGTDKDTILSGLNAYVAQCERRGTEKRYIAMASTWLNQERWDWDYTEQETTKPREETMEEQMERWKREGLWVAHD